MKCAVCKKNTGKNKNGLPKVTCSPECFKEYRNTIGIQLDFKLNTKNTWWWKKTLPPKSHYRSGIV